jgi:hypothetical protein
MKQSAFFQAFLEENGAIVNQALAQRMQGCWVQ